MAASERAGKHPIQEVGDTNDPVEAMMRSLSKELLEEDLRQNKERNRRFLLRVAQNEAGNWQEIGRQLGIKVNVLRQLREDHSSGGSREQAYQMLVHWMNSDDESPTLERLLIALKKAKLAEVAQCGLDVFNKEDHKSHGGKPVTEELLNRITKDIIRVWKFLGRYLGLDESAIDSIAMGNRDKPGEQAHQMLMKWKQSNASCATSQVLINALKDVGEKNVARSVQEWETYLEH